MDRLKEVLNKSISEHLVGAILSGKRQKLGKTDKVKIRRVIIKNQELFQITEYQTPKVIHHNMTAEETVDYIMNAMRDLFKQCQITCDTYNVSVLVSSKGQVTVKEKAAKMMSGNDLSKMVDTAHNRTKEYIIKEDTKVPFLIDLGVMTEQGKIVRTKYDKFRQINRFLEYVRDIIPELGAGKKDKSEITILDFGCVKSYLTFAIYYYLHELLGMNIRIIGLDLKEDVINHCNKLAEKYGYDKLHFYCGDVARYGGVDDVDMMVTLHACDTATDYALARAVKWKAGVILSVPCCQHELNKTMKNDLLSPVFSYGILKERTAALITDGIRASLLEQAGYDTQILEFIDMEHTPKNLLIRAVKRKTGKSKNNLDDTVRLMNELNVEQTLYKLLAEDKLI